MKSIMKASKLHKIQKENWNGIVQNQVAVECFKKGLNLNYIFSVIME